MMIGGLFNSYEEYMMSDMWKEKRKMVIKDHCEVCGIESLRSEIQKVIIHKKKDAELCFKVYTGYFEIGGSMKKRFYIYKRVWFGRRLNVHHKSYEHICNETSADLMTVCELCHKAIHKLE
jgi:regulator of sigma D